MSYTFGDCFSIRSYLFCFLLFLNAWVVANKSGQVLVLDSEIPNSLGSSTFFHHLNRISIKNKKKFKPFFGLRDTSVLYALNDLDF